MGAATGREKKEGRIMGASSFGHSSFDQVSRHLDTFGESIPMRLDQVDDLDLVVGRLEQVRKLSAEYGKIELSPYMELLLGVTRSSTRQEPVVQSLVAVGS